MTVRQLTKISSTVHSSVVTQSKDRKVIINLQEGYIFKGKSGTRYRLVRELGAGAMGAVYLVEEVEDGGDFSRSRSSASPPSTTKQYAVKVEPYPDRRHILQHQGLRIAMEKMVMKECRFSPFFPAYKDSGRTSSVGWIAMELVGPTLDDLVFETPRNKFSSITCLKIAIQVIKGLRDLHSKGFVHRDLKPDNIAIGVRPKQHRIYILDSGIARQYKTVDGVTRKPRMHVRFMGSIDYAPLCRHLHQEFGPKDDVEGLFYTIARLATSTLPWSDTEKTESIGLKKSNCRSKPELIFEGTDLCPLLSELWNYIAGLRYADEVDYSYLLEVLQSAVERLTCVS